VEQVRDSQTDGDSNKCPGQTAAIRRRYLHCLLAGRHGFQLAGKHELVSAVKTEVRCSPILEPVQIRASRESSYLRIRPKYITPFLAAGAAAAAITTAPAVLTSIHLERTRLAGNDAVDPRGVVGGADTPA
jgi:hypothetical protein